MPADKRHDDRHPVHESTRSRDRDADSEPEEQDADALRTKRGGNAVIILGP